MKTPKLDQEIKYLERKCIGRDESDCYYLQEALIEIRELMQSNNMTHETPNERRTRLIEQYAGQLYASNLTTASLGDCMGCATGLADAVIAATPQEPEPTRYPSEAETRLIELVEYCIEGMCGILRAETARDRLAAIKRDLGLV